MELKWVIEGSSPSGAFQKNGTAADPSGSVVITCTLPADTTLQRVHAEMDVSVDDDEKIFMNGFQTWTYCPEYSKNDKTIGVSQIPKILENRYHFDRYGDYHFVSYPDRKGITMGESWCYFRKHDQYRLAASLDEHNGYTIFQYDANAGILSIDRDCKGLKRSGSFDALQLFLKSGSEDEVFDAWFDAMQIHPLTEQKIAGYSSWYNRYQKISEKTIREDLKGCSSLLQPGDLFQIDDGWEPYVGDWLNPDPQKFSSMKEMADEIHAAGFKAGIWLAPFAAETKSSVYKSHPDWFIRTDGQPWCDGSNWSGFYSLDIDNPQVIAYLQKVFDQILNEWGFDLVKLDFLYAAAPFGNEKETRAGRMYRAMDLLRSWVKDKQILGCGVPVMPAFGKVEYCRVSCDVSLDWDDKWFMRRMHRERTSTKHAIETTVCRRQLNHRAYLSDPDVFFLRDANCKLSSVQKEMLASLSALLGGVWLTSDDPGSYSDEMKAEYNQYRHLRDASLIHVNTDEGITVTYSLDGRERTINYSLDEE